MPAANPKLRSISALSALRHVGKTLEVSYSSLLRNLDGLERVSAVDVGNHALTDISGLGGLTDAGYELRMKRTSPPWVFR